MFQCLLVYLKTYRWCSSKEATLKKLTDVLPEEATFSRNWI